MLHGLRALIGLLIAISVAEPLPAQAFVRSLGVLDPSVTQANIHRTICLPGWTRKVRPSAHFIYRLKREQLAALRYADRNSRDFEEDHIVPLEEGGAPRDPNNIRPQPWYRARVKDKEETYLHRAICRGEITLDAARAKIVSDWIGEYFTYADWNRVR